MHAAEAILDVGRMLIQAKQELPHGEFQGMVAALCGSQVQPAAILGLGDAATSSRQRNFLLDLLLEAVLGTPP